MGSQKLRCWLCPLWFRREWEVRNCGVGSAPSAYPFPSHVGQRRIQLGKAAGDRKTMKLLHYRWLGMTFSLLTRSVVQAAHFPTETYLKHLCHNLGLVLRKKWVLLQTLGLVFVMFMNTTWAALVRLLRKAISIYREGMPTTSLFIVVRGKGKGMRFVPEWQFKSRMFHDIEETVSKIVWRR